MARPGEEQGAGGRDKNHKQTITVGIMETRTESSMDILLNYPAYRLLGAKISFFNIDTRRKKTGVIYGIKMSGFMVADRKNIAHTVSFSQIIDVELNDEA